MMCKFLAVLSGALLYSFIEIFSTVDFMSMHLSAVTPSVLHPPSLGPLPAPPTPTWAAGRIR